MNNKEKGNENVTLSGNGKGQGKFDQGKGSRRRRGKGRQGSRGGFGGKGSFDRGKKFNDVSFYTKNKSITDAFAKLPFNYIVGNGIAGLEEASIAITSIVSYMLDWVAQTASTDHARTGVTYFDKQSSILNQVATIIYTQMRRSNAGATNNIEHVDVITSNLLASIDIYANAHYINRIFKIVNTYSWKNRGIPKEIFRHHLNIDFNDLIANQANYRGRYNTLVAKAKTIRTLANFPFIQALVAEFSNIFKDTDTDTGREQLMLSVKPFHHIYDPIGMESKPGGSVRLVQVKDVPAYRAFSTRDRIVYTGVPTDENMIDKGLKLSVLLDIMNAQIDALINDSDFNLIQADIEKAFGEQSGYMVIDPLTEESSITPVYSGEFMNMFHNGIFYSFPGNKVSSAAGGAELTLLPNYYVNSIVQGNESPSDSNTYLECYQGFFVPFGKVMGHGASTADDILDLQSDDPTVEDIIIATRYKTLIDDAEGDFNRLFPITGASTGDVRMTIIAGANFICWGGNITYYTTNNESSDVGVLLCWDTISNDYYNPYLYAIENHPIPRISLMGAPIPSEINNIRGIRQDELRFIHDACFLSLWDLPSRTNI